MLSIRINGSLPHTKWQRSLLLAFVVLLIFSGCNKPKTPEERVQVIEEVHHIKVVTGHPSQLDAAVSMHDQWFQNNVRFVGASLAESRETLKALEEALAIYPDGFVASVINSVFISKRIFIDKAEAAGTFLPGWVVLTSVPEWNGTGANYTNALHAFHHELASLVIAKDMFFKGLWGQFLPENWEPYTSENAAINIDEGMEIDMSKGFLTPYGTTSIGNDISVYAEHAFIEPDKLRDLATKHLVIAKKLGALISVYEATDPEFRTYFKETRLYDVAIPPPAMNITIEEDMIDMSKLKPAITQ